MDLWIADAALILVVIVAAVTDAATGRIPNWLTYPAALAGLVYWTVVGGLAGGVSGAAGGLLDSTLGLLIGFVPMFIAFAMGGIGGGDAKLAGAIGALARWRLAIYAMFYGFIAAALFSLLVMVSRRMTRRTVSRIWRFLWVLAAGGRPSAPTDASSPRIATAVPWAVGTIWAVIEQHCLGGRTLFDRLLGG